MNVAVSIVIAFGLVNLVFVALTGKDIVVEICRAVSVGTQDVYLAIATCCLYALVICIGTLVRRSRDARARSRRYRGRNRANQVVGAASVIGTTHVVRIRS